MLWKPDLAVGIREIDAQHEELLDRFDRLMNAMEQGRGREQVGETMSFLSEYVFEHFGAEKGLMHEHGYPDKERHLDQHRHFKEELTRMEEVFHAQGGSFDLAAEMADALAHWFINHILTEDGALGEYLKRCKREVTP